MTAMCLLGRIAVLLGDEPPFDFLYFVVGVNAQPYLCIGVALLGRRVHTFLRPLLKHLRSGLYHPAAT